MTWPLWSFHTCSLQKQGKCILAILPRTRLSDRARVTKVTGTFQCVRTSWNIASKAKTCFRLRARTSRPRTWTLMRLRTHRLQVGRTRNKTSSTELFFNSNATVWNNLSVDRLKTWVRVILASQSKAAIAQMQFQPHSSKNRENTFSSSLTLGLESRKSS